MLSQYMYVTVCCIMMQLMIFQFLLQLYLLSVFVSMRQNALLMPSLAHIFLLTELHDKSRARMYYK